MLLLQRVWDSVLLYQEWLPDSCPSIETIFDDALMDDLKKKNVIRYFYLCITASKITAFLDSWKQDRRSSVLMSSRVFCFFFGKLCCCVCLFMTG